MSVSPQSEFGLPLGLALGGGSSRIGFIRGLSPAAWFRYGVGITVTGQGVSQWDDQSGNGRHLKQATDGARPTKNADNSILFNGTDEFLKCDAFTLNQPETVYILFKQVAWTSNAYVHDGNGLATMLLQQHTTTPQLRAYAGLGVGPNANTALTIDTYGVVSSVYNGASSSIQVNNGTVTTGDAGASNAGGFTLAARATGDLDFSNIEVKEVILFAAAHDTATRARVIRYLMSVGGI
jgi:hypothetical protein